jgi:hypothetical protein
VYEQLIQLLGFEVLRETNNFQKPIRTVDTVGRRLGVSEDFQVRRKIAEDVVDGLGSLRSDAVDAY